MTGKPWEKYQGSTPAPAPAQPAPAKPWEKAQAARVALSSNPALAVGQAVRGAAAIQPEGEPAGLYGAFAKRGAELGGNFLQFFDTMSRAPLLPDYVFEQIGVQPPPRQPGDTWLGQAGDYLQGLAASVDYQPKAPWESIGPSFENEGVLGGLGTLGRYILEQGVQSIPDMAAVVANPAAYGMALSQEIGETRAQNNGRQAPEPMDVVAAMPAAAASALLERFGVEGLFHQFGKNVATRILAAAGREAGTEFLQEQAQYAGETVGTDKPWDVWQSLRRGAAAAVAGAGLGAAGRGVVEIAGVDAAPEGRQELPTPITVPEAVEAGAAAARSAREPKEPSPIPLGETVGLKTPNARGGVKVINAVPERVENGVVFWRDEDGVVNTDLLEDFQRDVTAPVAPKKPPPPAPPAEFTETAPPPVVADPLANAEPERGPAPVRLRETPLLAPEQAPAAPAPRPSQRASYDQQGGNVPLLRRAVQTWDESIFKAEDALARGIPNAKTEDEIGYMRRAREEAASRLTAAMQEQDRNLQQQGTSAEASAARVQETRRAQNIANQEALAAEADAAMARNAQRQPAPEPQTAEDLAAAARRAPKPQRLVNWILSRGGMRDPGGDLRAMDLQRRPGFIRKAREAGGDLMGQRRGVDAWDPDYVREAAIEAGYLPQGATTRDLYDAIGADLRGQGPVRADEITEAQDRQEAEQAARAADRYESMYGTDEALADLRFNSDRLGLGWDPDATAGDLQAAIDERLALMDAASVDEAERLVTEAERAADEALAAEPDQQIAEMEETDAEPEPAVEDRAPAAAERQAVDETAEGDAAAAAEPEAAGNVPDERAFEEGSPPETEGAGAPRGVLESVVGPRQMVTDVKGNKIPAPRVFYRGTNPGDERRIKTGDDVWDSHLFAASNEKDARLYGENIETLDAAPDAKILYEGTAEWRRVAGAWRRDENMLQYARRASDAAKAAGYDAAWFKRQGDIGTAIFNPAKFAPRRARLESVEGPAPDENGAPTERRAPIGPEPARGRDAINQRVVDERRRERQAAERRVSEGRTDKVPEISAEEQAAVESFTAFLGEKLLEGVRLNIIPKGRDQNVLGNFDPKTNVVTVFRSAVRRGMFSRTMMHELWHAMEGALAPQARETVIGEWRKQAERYMLRQDWMQAFAQRGPDGSLLWVDSALLPADTEAFMKTPFGQRAVASRVVELRTRPDGQAQAYINWNRDNYRFHNASEFFAESMTDRFQSMREGMDAYTGNVFEFMRAIWQRMVQALRELFGADVMAKVFNGFRDGAVSVPEQPLPPIYEQVIEGGWVLGMDPDKGPDKPLGERGLQQLQQAAQSPVPGPDQPLLRMGKMLAMFKQGTWLSRKSKEFAPYYQAVLDEHYLETRLIRDGGDAMQRLLKLNPAQRKIANQIFEVARLAGMRLQPTGRRLVVQVPQIGVGGMTVEPALSAPGDIIRADQATTDAVHDTINYLQSRWYSLWGSIAAANGYKGEFTPQGIAQAKADAIAANDRGAESLADFAKELHDAAVQNERDGYIPFMRYGDTAIIVKDKNATQGQNPVVYMTMVDTTGGARSLVSGYGKHPRLKEKLKEVRGEYPASQYTVEEKRLGEQDLDALDLPLLDKLMIAARLDRPAAAVNVYRQMINLGTPGQERMFKDIAGAIPQAARRKIIDEIKNGLLRRSRNVPGYETDFVGRSLLDYNRATSGIVAKRMLRERVEDGRRGVFGHRETKREGAHKSVQDWVASWEQYIDKPEADVWRTGRFLGFYMNMFGSFSSALVNTMSTATVTVPQMMGWSNTAASDVIAATRFGIRGMRFSMKKGAHIDPRSLGLSGALLDAVLKADAEGVLSPSLSADLYGKEEARYNLNRKGSSLIQGYLEVGASMFNYAEQANRYIAFIAAWKAAQKVKNRQRFAKMYANNARVQEMIKQRGLTPEAIATFMVENTQFIGGQIDRSPITRGAGGILLQFKQYALNYIRVMRENFRDQGPRGKMVGLTMLGTMMFLGGVLAVPGVEDLMAAAETLYNLFTEEGWDAETTLREFFEEVAGSKLGAELVTRGFSREYTGMDLSSRIGIGRLSPEFGDPLMSIPLVAATVGRFQEAAQRYNRGETAGGTVALISPLVGKGIADVLRGFWVLDSEGYVTRTGTQKFAPSEITFGERLMQAAGLRPAKFARALEYDYAQRRIATQMNGPRASLMDELANAGYNAMRARENGDEEAALRFEEQLLSAWDAAWEAYGDPSTPPDRLVKPPEWKDVMRAIEDRASEFSRIKRAPKLAREAMEDIPYIRE